MRDAVARPWPPSDRDMPRFGRYLLDRRLPCGTDDECWLVRVFGLEGFARRSFLRRFAAARLDAAMIEACKRQAIIQEHGIAALFEIGIEQEWGFIVGDHVDGASLAELHATGRRVPWLVALAIVHDACTSLARIARHHADGAITPRRLRFSLSGEVMLCMGPPPLQPRAWHRVVCEVIEPILALAASDDERALLHELLADDDPDAVWVASDALVQRHPELDPVLPIVFLALAGRGDGIAAHAALVERVPIEQLRELWHLVMDVVRRQP